MDPLAEASSDIADRVKKFSKLRADCYQFANDSNMAMMKTMASAASAPALIPVAGAGANKGPSPDEDRQYSAQYASNLAPRLAAWRVKAAMQFPSFSRNSQDWSKAETAGHLQFICTNFGHMVAMYRFAPNAQYSLVKEGQDLAASCQSLYGNWSHGTQAPRVAVPDIAGATAAVHLSRLWSTSRPWSRNSNWRAANL